MSENVFSEYWRWESMDAAALARFCDNVLERLAAVGIEEDEIAVDFAPDLGYVEIQTDITLAQADALGFTDEEKADLRARNDPLDD